MGKIFFKKHLFKISLVMIVIIASILCIFSLSNYQTNSNLFRNGFGQKSPYDGPRGKFQAPSVQNSNGKNNTQWQNNNRQQNQGKQTFNNGTQRNPGNQPSDGGFMNHNNPQQGQPSMPFNNRMQRRGSNSQNNYSLPLILYSGLFLIVFIALYFTFLRKKVKLTPSNEKFLLFTLIAVGLLLRIWASTLMEGFTGDVELFKSWAVSAANNFTAFYSNARSSDYPPFYMYILFLLGKIFNFPVLSGYSNIIIKLPSIIADIVTAFVIYKLGKKYLSYEMSLLISAFYIFNPAIFINSALWGQVDSFFTLLIVASVFLMSEKKIMLSSMLLTAAVLMKPQGIIYTPVLFFELVRQKNLKSFIKAGAAAIITALMIIVPFSLNKDVFWILKLYAGTVSEYPFASVNGFNLFSLIGANYVKDSNTLLIFSYHTWGMIFIVMTTLFSWFIYIKGKDSKYASVAALIQIAGVFTLSVGMHERYLFPAAALSILSFIYLSDKRLLLLAAGFSTTIYLNTHTILFNNFLGMNSSNYSPIVIITSLLNVLLLIYLVKVIVDIVMRKKLSL